MVAKSRKKQKNRWNKRKTTTIYSNKRKSILLDVDAFLEYYQQLGKAHHLSEITEKQRHIYELMDVRVPT